MLFNLLLLLGLFGALETRLARQAKLSNRIGVGLVVRNFCGSILQAAGLIFRNIVDVEIAEAKAILEEIELASNKGFAPLCVESDTMNVVSLCCANSLIPSELGAVI
ncbi:hypothetical protein JRO89_XS01G0158700 [Xanthoceras sorbifolium]|uniref:RNase H type-1 domain-containing protein n=1 Tax=Xanthoceras sorbifolium TaxID=99658 RepID=A0ABQ8IK34_9ROSI|nr:hypothetical protein JRO89_XS01G0158700 [Xanthoceras sorbifolium]